jgi:LysM repeat protein
VFAALISVASLSAAIGALSSLRALLGLAALAVAVLILYVAMLRHARRLATEQEWASPFAADDSLEWLRPEGDAAGVRPAPAESFSPAPQPALEGWAAVPFFLTCTADWLLTPVVASTRWFASARDTQRADAWADRIAAIQSSMRQRSRRALTVSVVATIGVTGLGSMMDATSARPGPASLGSSTGAAATLTSATTPAAATSSGLHYTVQPGDTLWGIAQQFGTTVDAVASANQIQDPNLIYEGETFVINVHYTVQLGDTLAGIAERFGTTVEALASANNIADPNLIYVGQTFLIVGGDPPAAVPKWTPPRRPVARAAVPAWKPVPATVHPTPVARVAPIPVRPVRPVTPVPPTTQPLRPVARPLPTTPPVRPVLPVPTTAAVRPVTRPVAAIPPVHVAPPPVPVRPVTPPPVAVSPPGGGAGYVNPFAYGSWSPARIDQGVDWIANAVSPVVAIGNGVVTYSSMHSGWPDGAFIAYRLTSGSHAGLYIYVAEHLTNLLPAGTPVRAGQVIATALPGSPFTEWGFAAPSGPVPASSYDGAVDGTATAGGRAFARFLIELGAGAPNPGPGPDRP